MKTATTIRSALVSVLAIVSLLGGPSTTRAQAPSLNFRPHLYLAGGTTSITNPTLTKDQLNQGFSLMFAVGLPLNPGIEIVPKIQYHKFKFTDKFLLATGLTLNNPDLTVLTYGADLKWGFLPAQAPTRPYFLIGGGSSTISQDALGATIPSVDETKLYLNVGGGLDVKVGPSFAFFVEGKYTFVNSSSASLGIFPLMAGIRIM